MESELKVEFPFEVADLVERVFLPSNPRKMRKADPSVVEAVKSFKAIMSEARYTRTPPAPTELTERKRV